MSRPIKNNVSKKIILLLSIVCIIIVFSGCTGLLKPKKGISQSNVHVGTLGLEISLVKNAPPAELQMAEDGRMPFQVGVSIENKGAYDIKNGYLLLAVDKTYMEIMGWELPSDRYTQVGASGERVDFRINGRSELEPVGQSDVLFANVEALPLDKQSVTHTSRIGATVCYDYGTTASADVCIDTDVYNLKPLDKVCTVKDITLSGGQGGPISIDKIDVTSLPNSGEGDQKTVSPQFVVHVTNKGLGIPFRPDKVRDACSATSLKPEEINAITIDDITFSGYSLKAGYFDCTPTQLKLGTQDDKFICKVKKGVISAKTATYSTTLQVMLKYGYSQSISKETTVNRLN